MKLDLCPRHLDQEVQVQGPGCLYLTLLALDQWQGFKGRSRVTFGRDKPNCFGQQGIQVLAFEWKPTWSCGLRLPPLWVPEPWPRSSRKWPWWHFPIQMSSLIFLYSPKPGENTLLSDSVLILDSENMITI